MRFLKVSPTSLRDLQPNTHFIKGDDSGEDTPLPIPNRVVKLASADGTAGFPCGRVGRRPFFMSKTACSPCFNQVAVQSLRLWVLDMRFGNSTADRLRVSCCSNYRVTR